MKRFILFAALGSAVAAVSLSAMVPEQVKIDTGVLAGTTGAVKPNVRIFKGIPFAAPPLGDLRWKAPQPAAKWDGVFKADAFGPSCTAGGGGGGRGGRAGAPGRGGAPGAPGAPGAAAPQAPAQPAAPPRQPPASEDCLTVNVWTSANSASDRRPVMVWIYGGGFTGGSGGMQWYDGEDLAAKGPVIVTLNYRLGSLGFFAHPELAKEAGHTGSGNYGMMDAIEALRWVKRNISAFGGDPNNVTIFGESAGAIMIGGIVGSPQAKGLFHRAIVESGGWMGLQMGRMTTTAQAQGAGAKALEAAGIKTIAELRAKPLAELPALGGAGLVIDGYVIPEDLSITFANGRQNDVDLLAGSNKDENTFFGGGGGGRGGGRGGAAEAAPPAPGSVVEAYVSQAQAAATAISPTRSSSSIRRRPTPTSLRPERRPRTTRSTGTCGSSPRFSRRRARRATPTSSRVCRCATASRSRTAPPTRRRFPTSSITRTATVRSNGTTSTASLATRCRRTGSTSRPRAIPTAAACRPGRR